MDYGKQPSEADRTSNVPKPTGLDEDSAEHKLSTIIRGFVDGATCLDAVFDSGGNVNDFIITHINERAARFYAQPQDVLIGKLLSEVLPEQRAQYILSRIKEVFLSGQSIEIDEELLVADGPLQVIQQFIPFGSGVLAVVKDVTAAHRAQIALRDSQEYLSSVIANVPIIIYEIDRQGQFKLSAGRSLAQIGLAAGEAVGQSIFDFFPQDSHEVVAFQKALLGETVNTHTRLGDGYFTSRYTPRFDEKGNIGGVLGVSYDITEQHNAEQKLHQAQRLEAVGQLTGGIAHDFNNLLAVVIGNLDLLSIRSDLDDSAHELIQQAMGASQRGSMLTKRLLAFSRQQVLQPQNTDIAVLLDGMMGLLERTFAENISITCDLATDLWRTHIDPSQLENAVLNLCVNARDAMPDGGQIVISGDNQILQTAQASELGLVPGEYVRISVTDTGCGIADEVQKLVFEPFFTTKDAGEGSGLGLSMVYGFVEQSGGILHLTSALGSGSRFDLYFPRSADESPTDKQTRQENRALQGRGERVLVVEDDRAVRDLVVKVLRSLNYTVHEAAEAQSGLAILAERGDIDLLFSDIVLPGEISGIQLARRVQHTYPNLKILMTTGYARDSDQAELAALPELQMIRKPFHIEDLGRKLRVLLDG
jgi:PAS domain S-box-containing protein